MIGTKLGSYEIVEQIGEGGMATVYRAYQPSVDRCVAGQHIASASTALSPQAIDAAKERGRTRDLWVTAEELLAELEG